MFWFVVALVLAIVAWVGIAIGNAMLKSSWMEGHRGSTATPDPRLAPHLPWVVNLLPATLIALVLLLNAFVVVEAGSVGVLVRLGAVTGANLDPGFQFIVPLIDDVKHFDTRTQKEQVDAAAASKDLQEVKATVALNYHLDARYATDVFRTIGPEYKARVIDPTIQEAFKSTTAQFAAAELITDREAVKQKAREFLKSRLEQFHIIVDEFNIVNFDFSDSFNAAIEAKVVAQQQVQTAENQLARAKVDAQQQIVTAQANAEAQRLQQATLTDLYVEYLAIQKWNGVLPLYTGGGTPFVPLTGAR